ncbi:ferric reductase-like transmembrane domain-containing protein [Pilimelia columellifera]|uniref:Uncharacterized protein n=1 Tax=Pilimelia columellifera subsp. columellifera TaxID=706583 RepID=A0ABN3NM86_9ACTN
MAIRERAQQSSGTAPASGRRRMPKASTLLLSATGLVAFWALAALTTPGRVAYTFVFYFMHFYAGVFVLMALTGTIMFGLIATDRIVLDVRLRVWMQIIHRGMGVFAMACLGAHVWTKATGGTITVFNAIVPFTNPGATTNIYLGLGPVTAYLMLLIFWTGIARARFVNMANPRLWRVLHSAAYLAWPLALMHGLGAGRRPADWVTYSYLLCVVGVTVALFLRLATSRKKRQEGGRMAQTTMATEAAGGQARTITVGSERERAAAEREVNPLAARWESSAQSWDTDTFAVISDIDDAEQDQPEAPEIPERTWIEETPRERAPMAYALPAAPAVYYEDEPPARRSADYVPRRAARDELPRGRHSLDDRGGYPARATGRYSVASSAAYEPRYESRYGDVAPDDTPTLVDLSTRRAMRDSGRGRSQPGRRAVEDQYADEPYYRPRWREAQ